MSDGFVDPDRPAFSLDQLRQDEEALDKRASLVDTKTDVDYRETFSLIGRCIILIRFYWRRYVVVLSMDWIATVISVAVAPWAGKVLVDNVVLGQPIKEDGGGYPAFLLPVLEFLEGSSAFTIMSWLAMWTIAALVARVCWQYVQELIGSRLEHSMLHMVRSRLFESLRSLPVTKLDDQPIGDSVYRAMHDVRGIPQIIQRLVRTPGGALLTFFTALFTMLSAYPDSPVVVLFAIGALPVFLLATTPFSRMLRRRAQAQVAAGTVLVSTTEEGMDNIQAVQSLGANKIEKARFSRVSADQFRRDRFELFARNLVEQFGEIAGQFLYWAFMLYLLGKVITNELTPGDYAVVFGYYWTM
ncbi:MAG: ABC transporter ATP-binding protein, partial [Gammaproteobacteria bacterium]|nr:ABC transporter ATP-binding protein [Gammaproteobacteria bacterium]